MYPLQKINPPRRRGRRLPVQELHLTRIRYVPAAHRFDSPLKLRRKGARSTVRVWLTRSTVRHPQRGARAGHTMLA